MRRWPLALGAAAALIVGAALVVFALDVRGVPHAVAADEAALLDVDPGTEIGAHRVGPRLARTAVGAPDRRPYLSALQLYRDALSAAGIDGFFGDVDLQQADHGTRELQIAGVLAKLHDPAERSQAETMLATLILLYAKNGRALGGSALVQQAATSFQEAVRLDPANDAAKYDLELLLRMHSQRSRNQRQKTQPKPGKRPGGAKQRIPGSDY